MWMRSRAVIKGVVLFDQIVALRLYKAPAMSLSFPGLFNLLRSGAGVSELGLGFLSFSASFQTVLILAS